MSAGGGTDRGTDRRRTDPVVLRPLSRRMRSRPPAGHRPTIRRRACPGTPSAALGTALREIGRIDPARLTVFLGRHGSELSAGARRVAGTAFAG